MIINEAGEYTLQYTATDACGNSTTVQRDLVVEAPPTYRTVLYTDGTFIINESDRDEAANVQAHGQPTNVYDPFDPNGDTNVKKYIFSSFSQRPWDGQKASIKSVEIGSNISPTDTRYWFYGLSACEYMELSNIDTSHVTNMSSMFGNCYALKSLDLTGFDTGLVTNMSSMFDGCEAIESIDFGENFNTGSTTTMGYMFRNCRAVTSLDLSVFVTSLVNDMSYMFYNCFLLKSLDISNFNTSIVINMSYMFYHCDVLETLDLSSFNTPRVTNMAEMFRYDTSMKTIYASINFIVTQVTSDANMFGNMSSNLVGGAGTVWISSYKSKTYAHIDGGVSDPGLFTAKS